MQGLPVPAFFYCCHQDSLSGRKWGVGFQVAFDGGFASKANLATLKAAGVENVAFHKRRGLCVEDMTKSSWIYRKLIRFRAGIEAVISFLKRSFGLDRCIWKGYEAFKSYVSASILSYNLLVMARSRLE